jgi:hypothetical protein
MVLLLFESFGDLAMHRSITAAVMHGYMRPNLALRNPTNMGGARFVESWCDALRLRVVKTPNAVAKIATALRSARIVF